MPPDPKPIQSKPRSQKRPRCRRLPTRLFVSLVGGLVLSAAAPAAAAPPKSVLVLASESLEMPSVSAMVRDISAAVKAASGEPVNVFTESLERSRFPGDDQRLVALLRQRYGIDRPSVIVAICEPAVKFVLRYRDLLFQDIPLLYAFVDERMVHDWGPLAATSGVALKTDYLDLTDVAFRLHPAARSLVVAGGVSEFDLGWQESFRRVAPHLEGRATVTYFTDRTLPELLGGLASLPDDALILYLSMSRDRAGAVFTPRDVLDMIRRVSRVPIYAPSSSYLSHGSVGGTVMDLEAHGRAVGRMAARVLAGASPSGMKPEYTAGKQLFDWRELDRFGISEGALPAGSEVLNRQTEWTINKGWIGAVLVLVAAQTVLIAALVAQRRKRAALQRSLDDRLEFGTLLSEVSTALSAVPLRGLDATIRSVLERIRQHAGADVVAILDTSAGPLVHLAVDPSGLGGQALAAACALVGSPLGALKLASFQPLAFGSLDDVPRDAGAERSFLAEAGVRSLAMVRLEVGRRALGVLCCLSRTRETGWPAERQQQLRALAEVIANALQRQQTADAVAHSDRLRGSILSSIAAQIAVLDRSGVIIAVNDAWTAFGRVNGVGDEASISPGVNYLDVCRRAAAEGFPGAGDALSGVEAVCDGRSGEFEHEYQCQGRGAGRWFAMKVVPLKRTEGGAVVTHREVTSEKRQDIALRDVTGRLITAQEDERRRVARELHDDLQQRLALLAIELDGMALGRPLGGHEDPASHARRLWTRTNEISSEIHRISHRLLPLKLETLGLLSAIDGYCREVTEQGVPTVFAHSGVPASVPGDVALCLFRVIQEALRNVVKHSGALEARVSLIGSDGSLQLMVADGGCGFDVDTAIASGGLGLVSMRERLRLLGGDLRIQSTAGAGTRIDVSVPLGNAGASASPAAASTVGTAERESR
jgi:signal transduction histidine kinase